MIIIGCVGKKLASEEKQRRHWYTHDKKEVTTCCILSNQSDRGYRMRIYHVWCARNKTINAVEQRLIDQRRLIARTNKLTKLEIDYIRRTVGGLSPSTYVQDVQEPELSYRESEHELTNQASNLSDLA